MAVVVDVLVNVIVDVDVDVIGFCSVCGIRG
jgi:hypothetical protein